MYVCRCANIECHVARATEKEKEQKEREGEVDEGKKKCKEAYFRFSRLKRSGLGLFHSRLNMPGYFVSTWVLMVKE